MSLFNSKKFSFTCNYSVCAGKAWLGPRDEEKGLLIQMSKVLCVYSQPKVYMGHDCDVIYNVYM